MKACVIGDDYETGRRRNKALGESTLLRLMDHQKVKPRLSAYLPSPLPLSFSGIHKGLRTGQLVPSSDELRDS